MCQCWRVCSFVGIQYVRSKVCESACVWVSMTFMGYIGDRLSDIHITYFHNIYNSYSYSAYVYNIYPLVCLSHVFL